MNPKQEITDLTACRALFAAWVFIYHVDLHAQFAQYLGPAANLVRHGYLGVDGFFILSGLILTRTHPEFRGGFAGSWRFLLKRIARLYPVHLAIIILLGVFVLTGAGMGVAPRDPSRFGLGALWQNLLLVQGWGFSNPWAWNYPSWTISTEWAGYLVFPIFCFVAYRQPEMVIGQILLICVPVLAIVALNSGHYLNIASGPIVFLRFFPEFIAGITASRIVHVLADFLPTRGLAIFGFNMWILLACLGADFGAVLGLWVTITALTMHADAERRPLFRFVPWLRALGLISYTFYMSFATVELLLAQVFRHYGWDPSANKLLYAGLMTALTFALALVLHVLVENPGRQLPERLLGKAPEIKKRKSNRGKPVQGTGRKGPAA